MSAHWHGNHWLQGVSFDEADPLHYRCLLAVQDRLRSLALADIASAKIVVRWLPRLEEQEKNVTKDVAPMVIVSPPGKEIKLGGLNSTDDVGYPVIVAFFDPDPGLANNMSRNLKWRERAERSLDNQRLTGVSEIEKVDTTPDLIIDLEAWKGNWWFSAFAALCIGRRTRGS